MPGKKAVFAGTMQVPGISVPVRIICSGRRTLGVKVDAGGDGYGTGPLWNP